MLSSTALMLAAIIGCSSTHEATILLDRSHDAHVLVTGFNPLVELDADPNARVDVSWQLASMRTEKQTLGAYLARTMHGGGAFVLSSDQPASVRVTCKGASGLGVTQPANVVSPAR